MDTKLKSDIAESAVVTELLKRGFRVLKPIGDRLPYDLAVDINGELLKLQVKSAWFRKGAYIVDSRRTKTNRRQMLRERYNSRDFDFAVLKEWPLLLLVFAIAVAGKLLGTVLSSAFTKISIKKSLLLGWGMNSRGGIELAIALLALRLEIITPILYSLLM